ncbi:MAG: uroporphyrinogen-III C-methyltransferase [Gammaproteobacteria bacterium]
MSAESEARTGRPGKSLVPVAPGFARRPARWPAWLALVLALVALGLAIAGWVSTSRAGQRRDQALAAEVQALNQRYATLASSAASRRELENDSQNTRQNLKAFSDRLDSLEATLTNLRRRSERGRDAWIKAEAATLLLAANDQVQLNSDPQLALKALGAADARLKLLSDPQLVPVRQAIAKEQAALRAVPEADITGMAATLSGLANSVDAFPLKRNPPVQYTPAPQAASRESTRHTLWQRLGIGIERVARDIFTVRHRNAPVVPLLAPSQEYFLRQNLALRLAQARAALLERNSPAFDASVELTSRWLNTYFDSSNNAVSAALAELAQMRQQDIAPPLPDISASLTLLRKLEPPAGNAP